MKKLYLLILLLTGLTSFAFPPPTITDPTPLVLCDSLNNGFEAFDLEIKIPEVLGLLAPGNYTVNFYETLAGAQNASTPITNPNSFVNTVAFSQTIYIRVEDNNDGAFSTTSLDLFLQPMPLPGPAVDLILPDQVPYDGIEVFDLTTNTVALINGNSNLWVSYFLSLADAQNNAGQISNEAAFSGTNGQVIFARVENPNGCFEVRSFRLFITNPDIVFIPDANFKNILVISDGANQVAQDLAHNFTSVDANHDGEIQYTEAANISLLNISQRGIADLTGLEAFTNVNWLNTGYNPQLTTIPTTALSLLQSLSTSHCAITSLDFSNNPNLYDFSGEYNQLTSLDFSACPLMTSITCQNNQITTLNLTGLTQLLYLTASDNLITSVNTADLNSIVSFNVAANALTLLDTSGMSTVQTLICEHNDIDALNTAGCTVLTNLRCAYNNMTYLDVAESTALNNLDCSINTLLNLDLSANSGLCSLNCSWNNTLLTLNIKNGVDSCYPNFNVYGITNALLQFCCDDNEVSYFKNYFLNNMGVNVNVNSYCSFTPGGNFNTITPSVLFDADNNGCDINDATFPNVRFNIFDQTNSGASYTGVSGTAQFYTQAGNFDITPSVENPTWFTISPPSVSIPFANANNNIASPNFCIAPSGVHPDLEIILVPLSSARPGFDANYQVTIHNKGNQIQSQLNGFGLSFDATKLDFMFASETPVIPLPGTISWDFNNLYPFESKTVYFTLHVHAPTDGEPVNNGDVLNFTGTVYPIAVDENPSDNTFNLQQTVVGSFDPNEIICLEGNIVSPIEIGNYLHYTINFENTGTADAENIVVREVIDTSQFDVSSLQLLSSSASVTARLTGNIAEFIFPSINLHSGGHGNILLKIRTNDALNEGDTVSRTANIFFDYNFPVATLPEDTLFQSLSNPDVPVDASLVIYPNPSKGIVNVSTDNQIKSIQLFDIQGRILQTNLVNENQASIDITNQSKGVYFLKITSEKGIGVQKIVRE